MRGFILAALVASLPCFAQDPAPVPPDAPIAVQKGGQVPSDGIFLTNDRAVYDAKVIVDLRAQNDVLRREKTVQTLTPVVIGVAAFAGGCLAMYFAVRFQAIRP